VLGFKLCLVRCDRSSRLWVGRGGRGFIYWRERGTSMVIVGWTVELGWGWAGFLD